MKAKKSTNKKSKHVDLNKKTVTLIAALFATIIIILSFFVYRRYTMALQTSFPKKVGILKLESLTWKVEPVKKSMVPPKEGYEFISVNVSLVNIDTKAWWLTPVLQSYIKDKKGAKYGIEMVLVNDPFQAGSYLPNVPAKGELAYMVPIKDEVLTWCYDVAEVGKKDTALCQLLDKKIMTN
ncbi:MAG: DUF4352 domain-containing protein [bacterium]